MPRRTDLKKIFIIGSGPIVIGQACEFDYSGTQAVKALKEEGFEVVLLNSNPATIMTDPEFADRTYVEPMSVEAAEKIIARERPDALLPTLGGQTALNLAVKLHEAGVLEKYGVRLIGASIDAIRKAEDRDLFKEAMRRIGVALPKSAMVHSLEEAEKAMEEIGFPIILRPSFTMGGTGGGIAYNREEYEALVRAGLAASPVKSILVEESIIGWKEFELEVMRDRADNVVIICSIENFDPMGVHTGDSITVAPAQTLTDKEYQRMRQQALAIIREIGVETGGCNIQFGVNPRDGRLVVIEMNPRVSRSSALASKATGFPIAKIAARLAVGYTLDEIKNDITRVTPASFEPTIDYVVVKVPRFNFEKFRGVDTTLTTQMKSVGEVMAIGRTFKQALQKAIRGLETGKSGFEPVFTSETLTDAQRDELVKRLRVPGPERLFWVGEAFRRGFSVDDLFALTAIDPWFLREVKEILSAEEELQKIRRDSLQLEDVDRAQFITEARTSARHAGMPPDEVARVVEEYTRMVDRAQKGLLPEDLRHYKRMGFSDKRLGALLGRSEQAIRERREAFGIRPVYKRVDTCAAEFEAHTPYLYSSYEEEDESRPTDRQKVMILGGGPNRIGQGIEFDYCCVHASFALRDAGFETIMVNCNPETVSTDYDTSDRLYFEPLTLEDVLAIARTEKPLGAIVQFGGQTPLKLAVALEKAGLPILGTTPDAIDRAEDRERFAALIEKLGLRQPENGMARSPEQAFEVARRIGYPVMVRPSYVLGGRAMQTVYDEAELAAYMEEAVLASPEHPVLIDRFLKDAIEVDVDLVADRTGRAIIGGVMEHIEEAGVHSGDAACALPPFSLRPEVVERMKEWSRAMARELGVVGLMNVQFAVQNGTDLYVLEVNPRASRTVPFVSKATGAPLAKLASLCMVGRTLEELGFTKEIEPEHVSVKEAVFPFTKFAAADTILGPEMKSTGEVMGIDRDFHLAFAKSQIAAGNHLPRKPGRVFVSVRDEDKEAAAELSKRLVALGYTLIATGGTSRFLEARGIPNEKVLKVAEGRPNIVDKLKDGMITAVINTTSGKREIRDSFSIRRETLMHGVPYFTTIPAARAAVGAIEKMSRSPLEVGSLQEYLKRT